MALHMEKSFENLEIDEVRKLMFYAWDHHELGELNPEVDLVQRILDKATHLSAYQKPLNAVQ